TTRVSTDPRRGHREPPLHRLGRAAVHVDDGTVDIAGRVAEQGVNLKTTWTDRRPIRLRRVVGVPVGRSVEIWGDLLDREGIRRLLHLDRVGDVVLLLLANCTRQPATLRNRSPSIA